eukprot:jgi/Psemu1/282755/fgenesh1_pg.13_\
MWETLVCSRIHLTTAAIGPGMHSWLNPKTPSCFPKLRTNTSGTRSVCAMSRGYESRRGGGGAFDEDLESSSEAARSRRTFRAARELALEFRLEGLLLVVGRGTRHVAASKPRRRRRCQLGDGGIPAVAVAVVTVVVVAFEHQLERVAHFYCPALRRPRKAIAGRRRRRRHDGFRVGTAPETNVHDIGVQDRPVRQGAGPVGPGPEGFPESECHTPRRQPFLGVGSDGFRKEGDQGRLGVHDGHPPSGIVVHQLGREFDADGAASEHNDGLGSGEACVCSLPVAVPVEEGGGGSGGRGDGGAIGQDLVVGVLPPIDVAVGVAFLFPDDARDGALDPPKAQCVIRGSHESVEEDDVLAAGGFDLSTGNDRIDRAYRLARRELAQNIATNDDDDDDDDDKDKTRYFVAGAGWDQLWTRDTAYAVELAAGLLEPEVSRHSLSTRTERVPLPVALRPFQNADDKDEIEDENETETRSATVWQQDQCGHFGGWPNLSDAIVGARGAWHVYLYTGNTTFLEWAYEVTVDSLVRAEKEALLRNDNDHDNDDDRKSQQGGPLRNALFGGCSSFMESNSGYPSKYRNNGELVGRTKALSTNLLHYNGYYLAHKMGTILMEDSLVVEALKQRARELKTTIRERLWIPDDGTYAYLEDETGELLKHTEGLGVALALLSDDFESDHRAKLLLEHTHRTDLGIPSVWPPFDHELSVGDRNDISQRYHNGRIWPFVSGYFAIAAARHGRSDIFARELASLVDLSEQKDTFAEFYEPDKTFPEERRRQLWSDTGYLGIVYQGLFGMRFTSGGIEFRPTKYKNGDLLLPLAETISLINVKYRKAVLDVFVTGYGSTVTSFRINGVPREVHRLEASTTGKQRIDIELS